MVSYFKPVDYVNVRGRKVACNSEAINAALGFSIVIYDRCKSFTGMRSWMR